MCRYAMYGPYKEKWACFHCRKSFKRRSQWEGTHVVSLADDGSLLVLCPQCALPLNNMGLDFKAPRQNDIEQWKKVAVLFAHGYNFHSCGCGGPGFRPARLKEVPAFLEEQELAEIRWNRLHQLQQRADELKTQRKKKRAKLEAKRHTQAMALFQN